jgi:ABC-type transport system substrate-binding protein
VRLEIITIGNTTYLKANQQTWQTLGVPAAAAQRLADRWVKTRPQQVTGLTGFTLDNLAAQLIKDDSPWGPRVEQTTLDGNKVVVISQQDGSKLSVANTGPPYPLRGGGRCTAGNAVARWQGPALFVG